MPVTSDEVFLLQGTTLESMPSRPMREGLLGETLESVLQRFLQQYPELIPGKQIEPGSDDPPRFVLLRREMPIGNWSLDHLFVDQRGVLTLVETKLFENPEARREVIGQIIEYAANAGSLWARGQARQKASEFWTKQGKALDEVLRDAFDPDLDIDLFWAGVEERLEEGRIRLIIASDELRPEVRRMIEYLNREMENAEVLGLELKTYGKTAEAAILVPRLIGQTQSIADKRVTRRARGGTWTPELLREAYERMADLALSERLKRVLAWSTERGFFLKGTGIKPSFGVLAKGGKRIASFYSDGSIYITFTWPDYEEYLGGIEGRRRFAHDLKAANLLDRVIDPAEIVSGRNLSNRRDRLGNGV